MKLGEKIDKLYELREAKAELNKQIKSIEEEYKALESDILANLDEIGTVTAKATKASATVSESVVPNVVDWDELYDYIIGTNQPYLLERRPSVTAFRDLLEAEGGVPGIEPFNKVSLSLRKI